MTGSAAVLKRTPFRLAATFTALFAATVIALFAILFLGMTSRLTDQIHVRAQEAMEAFQAIDDERSFHDLAAVVASESNSVRHADFIVELVDKDGRHIAGNVRDIPAADGWIILERAKVQPGSTTGEPDDRFHAIWENVSEGRLLVGSSDGELRRTQTFLLEVLGIGLFATTLLGAACGAFIARQTQHRIDAFAHTLAAVSDGNIKARVPMSGSGDDIDHVGEQVNRTLDHLQKLMENVNQSSSDIAHDLKKPVGRLRQRLDIARRGASTASDFRASLDGALDDLDGIMETFDALLRITQIEAGARRARFANVDLVSILDDVAEIYAAVAEDAGHSLSWADARWKPALVRGDRELLVQLFANVIENAIRHCPAGTSISIALHEVPEGFRAELSDNGPGIPEADREKVFRRLYRLERARTTPGSGLGLTLVAAIAELHDATIALKDQAPGLCVAISFPGAAEAA